MDVEDKPGLVGEFLQFHFPQPHPRAVGATAVGGDRQFAGVWIALAPGADRPDGERGGVGGNPDADPGLVGGHVVDAIGDDFAERLVAEVVQFTRCGSPFGR